MATPAQVKKYIGSWFQLGKSVLRTQGQTAMLPPLVLAAGDRYTPEFEDCWQQILAEPSHYSLEGTNQSLADLLSDAWEITDCARCTMPIPTRSLGVADLSCPCHDLANWPNTELPLPRSPQDSRRYLSNICRDLQTSTLASESCSDVNTKPRLEALG